MLRKLKAHEQRAHAKAQRPPPEPPSCLFYMRGHTHTSRAESKRKVRVINNRMPTRETPEALWNKQLASTDPLVVQRQTTTHQGVVCIDAPRHPADIPLLHRRTNNTIRNASGRSLRNDRTTHADVARQLR